MLKTSFLILVVVTKSNAGRINTSFTYFRGYFSLASSVDDIIKKIFCIFAELTVPLLRFDGATMDDNCKIDS